MKIADKCAEGEKEEGDRNRKHGNRIPHSIASTNFVQLRVSN